MGVGAFTVWMTNGKNVASCHKGEHSPVTLANQREDNKKNPS